MGVGNGGGGGRRGRMKSLIFHVIFVHTNACCCGHVSIHVAELKLKNCGIHAGIYIGGVLDVYVSMREKILQPRPFYRPHPPILSSYAHFEVWTTKNQLIFTADGFFK